LNGEPVSRKKGANDAKKKRASDAFLHDETLMHVHQSFVMQRIDALK
jgi:hypothetical protein